MAIGDERLSEDKNKLAPPRRVTILGATGSVGRSTLDLINRQPDAYNIVA